MYCDIDIYREKKQIPGEGALLAVYKIRNGRVSVPVGFMSLGQY
jgi:hypothetical protein